MALKPALTATGTGGSNPAPWLEITFDGYANTAALMADRGAGKTFTDEDSPSDETHIDLMTDAASGLGLTKSMRYTFDTANGCVSQTVGRNYNLPTTVTELWSEWYVKFTATGGNFATKNPAGCGTPPAYKLIFGRCNGGVGRWGLEWGQQDAQYVTYEVPSTTGGVSDIFGFNNAAMAWDGAWHQLRMYWKYSSTTGASDGIFKIWFDGTLELSDTTRNINTTQPIYGIAIGRNQDQRDATVVPLYVWFCRCRHWIVNPGW